MKARTILLIEDCPITSCSTKMILEEYSWQVYSTGSYAQAIQICTTLCPDIILLNCFLCDSKEGIKLAANLSCANQIPIIFMTGYRQLDLEQHPEFRFYYDILLKPFCRFQLLRIIQRVMASRD